ncbi:MAG TPA: diguanylate cyclase [Candidatus Micrarchaeaceae archaeon]|nr:diguanylate cyclase [Candidatus Micrarchaeaceae archaeon]
MAELNEADGVAGVIAATQHAVGRLVAEVPGSLAALVVLASESPAPSDQAAPVAGRTGAVVVPADTSSRLRDRLTRGGVVKSGRDQAALAALVGLPTNASPIRLVPIRVLEDCPVALVVAGRAVRTESMRTALATLGAAAGKALLRERRTGELRVGEGRMRAFLESSSDLVLAVDSLDRLIYASPSVKLFLGKKIPNLERFKSALVIHPEDIDALRTMMAESAHHPGPGSPVDCRIQGRDRHWHMFDVVCTNLLEDPNARARVLTMRDITDRLELEDQLRVQAFHDPLTGLANRILFEERLDRALVRRVRRRRQVLVLTLDLDDFKGVNDNLGHAAGDQVLIEFARRVQSCLRPTDTFARMGGDEFAIVVEEAPDATTGEALAERIGAVLTEPIVLTDGTRIDTSTSVGIAVTGHRAQTSDAILREADLALYAAKARGKRHHVVYQDAPRD